MIASAIHNSNSYTQPTVYQHEWIDNKSMRFSWLNNFKIHPIPEENDLIECSKRTYSDSDESITSNEDCYVVVETQLPEPVDTKPTITEKELHFAGISDNDPNIEHEQFAESMIIEAPLNEHAVEHELEQLTSTQRSNNIVIHIPAIINKSIPVSNKNSLNRVKMRTNQKLNERQSQLETFVVSKQTTISNHYSRESTDSRKTNLLKPCSIPCRTTTTFANLSSERKFNHIQIQRQKPTEKTVTLARTLPFNHRHIQNCNRINDEKSRSIESNNKREIIDPFYLNNKQNTDATSTTSIDSTKTSTLTRFSTRNSRKMKYECYLSDDDIKTNEPCLLRLKYLDGRATLINNNIRESPERSTCSSKSASLRSNLSKLFHPNDISPSSSYRKRLLNHFQNIFKPHSTEKIRPWHHKTIFEVFNERKK